MPNARRSVALLIETSNAYGCGLLEGVVGWLREHERWSVQVPEQERGAAPPAWLSRWRGDGILARIETEEIAEAVRRRGVPVVNLSKGPVVPGVPCVETDDAAIARAAFEHLSGRGLRHFAFCGESRFRWSRLREAAFKESAAAAGRTCETFDAAPAGGRRAARGRMVKWLDRLPRPVGVMACYDQRGQELLEACREAGIAVPEEVAVLGVDDSHLLCELCDPPLSSVRLNTYRTGYEAASLLDELMSGRPAGERVTLVPPVGVTTRQSSDVVAVEDPMLATALRLMRDRALDGLTVKELLDAIPLSRRVLESRLKDVLGRTPHEELTRLRLNHAKRLLAESELPVADVGRRSGFRTPDYFAAAFKREVGQTPRAFRRAARGLSGG